MYRDELLGFACNSLTKSDGTRLGPHQNTGFMRGHHHETLSCFCTFVIQRRPKARWRLSPSHRVRRSRPHRKTFLQGAPLPAPPRVAPSYPPQELDRIVSPIALYPDPLLASGLSRPRRSLRRFPYAALAGGDQHHYLSPEQIAGSHCRLISCPGSRACRPCCRSRRCSAMMAGDMPWTEELGASLSPVTGRSDGGCPADAADGVQLRVSSDRTRRSSCSEGRSSRSRPLTPHSSLCRITTRPLSSRAPRPRRSSVAGAVRFGYGVRIERGVRAVGLGNDTIRLGRARGDRQQHTMAAVVDQPHRLCSSVCGRPAACRRAARGATRGARTNRA